MNIIAALAQHILQTLQNQNSIIYSIQPPIPVDTIDDKQWIEKHSPDVVKCVADFQRREDGQSDTKWIDSIELNNASDNYWTYKKGRPEQGIPVNIINIPNYIKYLSSLRSHCDWPGSFVLAQFYIEYKATNQSHIQHISIKENECYISEYFSGECFSFFTTTTHSLTDPETIDKLNTSLTKHARISTLEKT